MLTIQRFSLRPRKGWDIPDNVGRWNLEIGRVYGSQQYVNFFNSIDIKSVKTFISEQTKERVEDILVFYMQNGVWTVADDDHLVTDDGVFLPFHFKSDSRF